MTTTITKPTITQLEEAPIGAILKVWMNKESWLNDSSVPNRHYVKNVNKFNQQIWTSRNSLDRFSNDLRISVWYKAKLEY